MAVCNVTQTLPQAGITYSSPKQGAHGIRHFTLIQEPLTGYPLYYDDGVERRSGWYIICPHESYNLVTNPTFFNDLAGWSTFNANASRTNVNAFDNGFSVVISGSGDIVTAERRAYLELEITGFTPGQPYVFSMYLWKEEEYDSQDPFMGTISIVDDNGTDVEEVFSDRLEKIQIWQRLAVVKTIREDATSVFVRINLRSQDQQELIPPYNPTGLFNLRSERIFADMGQFEIGTQPTTPFHGAYETCATERDGCKPFSWQGAPHDSISYRSDCTRDSGILTSLSSLGFEILEHTGHGAPPVRDIFFDHAQSPGGEYQKTAVDTNVLTFSGYLCEGDLRELECKLFGLKEKIMPDPVSCRGKMLLVYVHDEGECPAINCDPQRHLAYCVTYIGGFEGLRNNLFQERLTLQFRAHNPFPFEWPGHTSHPLDFRELIQEPHVVKIGEDEVRGYPILPNDYRTIACTGQENGFVLGGDFEGGATADDVSSGLAVLDCGESVCDLVFVGGSVDVSIRDAQGNIIFGGSFTAPFNGVAIYYPSTGGLGGFGYTGDPALSLAAPFWAEVIVGSASGVTVISDDLNTTYATDGPVNALATDSQGNVYAFGNFTTINGVAVGGIARLNVTSTGCVDTSTAVWERVPYTVNGTINAAHSIGDQIYFGGDFDTVTPDPVDLCETVNNVLLESRGGDQSLLFQNNVFAPGTVRIQAQFLNPLVHSQAFFCVNDAGLERMTRITGKNSFGHTYNILIDSNSLVNFESNIVNAGPPQTYELTFDIDTTYVLGEPCATLNPDTVSDIASTIGFAVNIWAPANYPGGVGFDQDINNLSLQCVRRFEFFQGEDITLNNAGCLQNDSITAVGEGTESPVTMVFVHPATGDVYFGTESNGLQIWNGSDMCPFPGDLGGVGATDNVLAMDYCNCSLYILFEGSGISLVPAVTSVDYLGGVEKSNFNLVLHGPGCIQTFAQGDNDIKFCTCLECNETGVFDFGNGSFTSNARNLAPTLVGGGRYDMSLSKCDNDFKLLITDTEASTRATIVYERCFWGVDALCCAPSNTVGGLTGGVSDPDDLEVCCSQTIIDIRDPSDDDCADEGYQGGDLWYSLGLNCQAGAGGGGQLFVNTGGECCDFGCGQELVGSEGAVLLTSDDGDAFINEPVSNDPPVVIPPFLGPTVRFATGLNGLDRGTGVINLDGTNSTFTAVQDSNNFYYVALTISEDVTPRHTWAGNCITFNNPAFPYQNLCLVGNETFEVTHISNTRTQDSGTLGTECANCNHGNVFINPGQLGVGVTHNATFIQFISLNPFDITLRLSYTPTI